MRHAEKTARHLPISAATTRVSAAGRATVAIAFVRGMLAGLRHAGCPTAPLLERAHIAPVLLDEPSARLDLGASLGGLFSARQIADTQAQITGLQQKLNSLQSNFAALLANTQRGALNQLSVIEAAQPPNLPIGPDRLIIILLAAAVGFVML